MLSSSHTTSGVSRPFQISLKHSDTSFAGFWGFGTLAMFMIFYNIIVEGMKYATRLHNHHDDRGIKNSIKSTYQMCGIWYVSRTIPPWLNIKTLTLMSGLSSSGCCTQSLGVFAKAAMSSRPTRRRFSMVSSTSAPSQSSLPCFFSVTKIFCQSVLISHEQFQTQLTSWNRNILDFMSGTMTLFLSTLPMRRLLNMVRQTTPLGSRETRPG